MPDWRSYEGDGRWLEDVIRILYVILIGSMPLVLMWVLR